MFSKKSVSSWKKHLVRPRWELYNDFKDKFIVYLTQPINNWSDQEESISASPALISSENILDTYTMLYLRYDTKTNNNFKKKYL